MYNASDRLEIQSNIEKINDNLMMFTLFYYVRLCANPIC